MFKQWLLYRDELSSCPDGEMEIEFTLEFDETHNTENKVKLYKDRGTASEEVLFDSDIDHDDGAFQLQKVLAVDVCVPETSTYELEITDSAGNGFTDSDAEAIIYQNGDVVDTVKGNFGSSATVTIYPPTEEPSAAPSSSFMPSMQPTTSAVPSLMPSSSPTTSSPTLPTDPPVDMDTSSPTIEPTLLTDSPTDSPVDTPSPTEPPSPTTPVPTERIETRSPTDPPVPGDGSVVEIIEGNPDLETLVVAITAAGVDEILDIVPSILLFAPTNDAFAQLEDLFEDLAEVLFEPEFVAHLRGLLEFHASPEAVALSDLSLGEYSLPSVNGEVVTVVVSPSYTSVGPAIEGNSATVLTLDIAASNGFVSIVDTLLSPGFLSLNLAILTQQDFPTFAAALVEAGIDQLLQNGFGFTVRFFFWREFA